ncbi:MAG: succinylglutamate desuccinylase/aspartoacylase family protein [Gammaproteobacteria bacterium]|jgi:predicted deacylase
MTKKITNTVAVEIGGQKVLPGQELIVDLPVANLYTHTQMTMPVHVVNGRRPGPTLFITAAMHGDELNGIEIIKRLLRQSALRRLRGCLLAVPIANVFGFINRSRYLPDRRDLNRSFPGLEKGSIAARVAHLIVTEVIAKAQYGIDLHTGAIGRTNLPQIRANLRDARVLDMAETFGSPVIIDASLREGSLRAHAAELDIPVVVYEAGEAMRFDELSIRAGVRGVGRVMRQLGMLPQRKGRNTEVQPVRSNATSWVRAPSSGIFGSACRLGDRVSRGQIIGRVSDPFGEVQIDVQASFSGLVIGRSTSPLTHEGDALFHIARFDDDKEAQATFDEFQETHSVEPAWG